MFKYFKKNKDHADKLYNKILYLSRNKFLYTKLYLEDTFQNRINLIFMHTSFLFIKIKQKKTSEIYKKFYQRMFDLIFFNIELNMREIGFGDVTVNKNMKSLTTVFYNILLNCEKYENKNLEMKNSFLSKYLSFIDANKTTDNIGLIEYFDNYQAFCFDLSSDSVLKGDLNFNYK